MIRERPLGSAEALLAVIDHGGFAPAARALGVAQSTISRQVDQLEKRTGTRLLARTTRSIRLTDAGLFFVERARAGLAALAEAEAGAAAVGVEPSGLLRVTMPQAFGRRVVVPVLAAFAARHPKIRLELDLSDLVRPLDRGAFDIGVRLGPARGDEPAGERLRESRLLLVGTPDQASRYTGLEDLSAADAVVVADPVPRLEWPFALEGERRRVRTRPVHVVSDVEAAHALVLAGAGVSLLPDWLVRADVNAGRLVELIPGWRAASYPVRMICASPSLAKVAAAATYLHMELRT